MTKHQHKAVTLRVAHINDTHSYFEPTSIALNIMLHGEKLSPFVSAGGFARIKTRAEQLKAEAQRMREHFLFLHAGDCFQGTLYFSLFKGEANAELLNALNIDAMVLGNHELDMGNQPVAEFVQRINFPLLCGNWDLSQEAPSKSIKLASSANVKSYLAKAQRAEVIVHDCDGESVALFGLSIDQMSAIANPDNDTPFVNALQTAQNTVDYLHQQGINKIIVLSHLGYDADKALAEHVNGIGLIVGGHSHLLQGDFSDLGLDSNDPYGININGCKIVQAGCYAHFLGHCQITFDAQGKITHFHGQNELLLGRRLFIDSNLLEMKASSTYESVCDFIDQHPNIVVCKKHPELQNTLETRFMSEVRKMRQQVVTHLHRPLRHIRIPDGHGGSELAPLVAQSFHYKMNQLGFNVDFAIHNAGGVRCSFEQGMISVADIAGKLLPFAVPIGVYDIAGKTIALALEGAINNALNNGVVGTGSGSYPYTHNLRFEYDATAKLGTRIKHLCIFNPQKKDWQPIIKNKYYRGTSSAYTMKGKEGYGALLNRQFEQVTIYSMSDCFLALLDKDKNIINQQLNQNKATLKTDSNNHGE